MACLALGLRKGLLALLVFSPLFCVSQIIEDDIDGLPSFKKNDSSYVAEIKKKNFRLTPYLAPSVSPEVGVLLSGGGLISWSLNKENPRLQRSSIPFGFGFSSTGAITASIKTSLFFRDDKNRLSGEIWYRDMPDNYWGVGYDAARTPEQPDSTTAYNREWFQVLAKYTHKVGNDLYIGLLLDLNETIATELNAQMRDDPDVIETGTNPANNSVGILFQYDTRDFTVNAYKGMFFETSVNFYDSQFFGENEYGVVILDFRQYRQLGKKVKEGRTLAWQVKSRMSFGGVPWSEMSFIGGPNDLRGYYFGRYRDKSSLFGLLEYRHMFQRKKPRKSGSMMSIFGTVLWVGTGSIAPDIARLSNWLPNAGIGLRVEVQPRMNARFDLGFGDHGSAFYISFNESF